MPEYTITLPRLHANQKKVKDASKRFNTINCGRRWGKTTLGLELIADKAIDGFPTAFYSPTYKVLQSAWDYFKDTLSPLISEKNEQLKTIKLVTGGRVDFWSADSIDSSRGRKYKRIIVDEAAFIKNLDDLWAKTIQPTLTDYGGDAFLFSTPAGKFSTWYDMCQRNDDYWASFHFTTHDNPFLDPKEIELLRVNTDPKSWSQEYLGQFIDDSGTPYFDEFRHDKHTIETAEIDEDYDLLLSFDFNYDPSSVLLCQMRDDGIYIIQEHQASGGTKNLLDKLEYLKYTTALTIVGDNSGHSHKSVSGNITDYDLIEQFFNRRVDSVTRKANSSHIHSRKISNSVFHLIPVYISAEGCPDLIKELTIAQVTKNGGLLKDSGTYRMDLVDPLRYAYNYWFRDHKTIVDYKDRIHLIADPPHEPTWEERNNIIK